MEIINDFDTSVRKAFDEIDPHWKEYSGIVVCGTHEQQDMEKIIDRIRTAREKSLPFLGICGGLQLAVIEYARNVLNIEKATSQEFEPASPDAVVIKMPELRVGSKMVGTRFESHWHNYQVTPQIHSGLKAEFLLTVSDGVLEELKHYSKPFVAVQYHPEYQSSVDAPHKLLVDFISVCK